MASDRVALLALIQTFVAKEAGAHSLRVFEFVALDAIVWMAEATFESLQAAAMSAAH
jgi:hypothetical protein